jgi:hypothetical protein
MRVAGELCMLERVMVWIGACLLCASMYVEEIIDIRRNNKMRWKSDSRSSCKQPYSRQERSIVGL